MLRKNDCLAIFYINDSKSTTVASSVAAVKAVSEASGLVNISVLKKPVMKYYLCYPREISQ